MEKSLNGGGIYRDGLLEYAGECSAESPDKNFRVMAETSFRNKMSRRSNSAGRGIYDRAHQVVVAPSRELLVLASTRSAAWNKVKERVPENCGKRKKKRK